MFLKATQIESIIEKLNECAAHYDHAKSRLKYQKRVSIVLNETVQEVEEKYKRLQSAEYIKVLTLTHFDK